MDCSRFELGSELSCLTPDLCYKHTPPLPLWKNANVARGAILNYFGLNSHFQLFLPWLIHPANPDHSPHPLPPQGPVLFCFCAFYLTISMACELRQSEWLCSVYCFHLCSVYCFHWVLLWIRGHLSPLGRMIVVFTTAPIPTNPTVCLISTCSADEDIGVNYRCSPEESFYKLRGP